MVRPEKKLVLGGGSGIKRTVVNCRYMQLTRKIVAVFAKAFLLKVMPHRKKACLIGEALRTLDTKVLARFRFAR